MKISTKGRYAVRILLDLAENSHGKNVSIREVSLRQQVSLKYLEGIVAKLVEAKLVKSERGKYGGYRLVKPASKYTIYEILAATEDSMAVVTCLETTPIMCSQNETCKTLPFWKVFQAHIDDFLLRVTLQDLINDKFK